VGVVLPVVLGVIWILVGEDVVRLHRGRGAAALASSSRAACQIVDQSVVIVEGDCVCVQRSLVYQANG
jgi:hypothetical protein